MEETEKEDVGQAYEVILKNCFHFHKSGILPAEPWFLENKNLATRILQETLQAAQHDSKGFAKRIAKVLISYKSEQESDNLRKACLIRESIDILESITKVSANEIANTSLEIKVKKSQSIHGPVTVLLNISNQPSQALEEGDVAKAMIKMNGSMQLKFISDDGNNKQEIAETRVLIRNIIEESPNYLSVVEKPELLSSVHKKGQDYEVEIQLKLKLSLNDRKDILNEKYAAVTNASNERNEQVLIFNSLQESLLLKFDDQHNEFTSLVVKSKPRDNCCEACSLL